MSDSEGVLQTDRQSISDVFADFYSHLYACRDGREGSERVSHEVFEKVPAVTAEELWTILKTMSNRKSPDASGVVAELLKQASCNLLQVVADMFNDILAPEAQVPAYWKRNLFKVLFKKGDTTSVDNYRPIAILPILYKLFSKTICARVIF